VVLISFSGTKVLADNEYTCNLLIEGNKQELHEGEEIVYEIKVTDIKAETGIIAYSGVINYDTNVFEMNLSENDLWQITGSLGNFFIATRKDMLPNAENQTIAKISFKVKEGVTSGNQTISISKSNFGMDNNKSFEIEDKSVDIPVYGSGQNETEVTINTESTDETEPKSDDGNLALQIWRNLIITLIILLVVLITVFYIGYVRKKR